MDMLVSTAWLADAIRHQAGDAGANIHIVDATYFLPEAERDAAAEYAAEHIPGALYLDLTALVDAASPFPNMLPPAAQFVRRIADLGIGSGARIVLYDNSPHRTAARAWWMFRLFGLSDVVLLDGGLAKWRAEGRALDSGQADPTPGVFTARQVDASHRTKAQVADALRSGEAQILDARSAARFTGEEPETRPGLASGHIPGSINIPYGRLFAADGSWQSADGLRAVFREAGVDMVRPVITTCGSGITAAILSFGLALLGKADVALYDGSWSEWGADPATPKATGAA
ncbi:MAG: 3-mercaptopyruvate sulfurtransferase [Sphingobium sp.]